jgi:hypothetical protein
MSSPFSGPQKESVNTYQWLKKIPEVNPPDYPANNISVFLPQNLNPRSLHAVSPKTRGEVGRIVSEVIIQGSRIGKRALYWESDVRNALRKIPNLQKWKEEMMVDD